ncbi:hypothetical protein AAE478_001822 [Parahypoxylon ruwenzoriense]
MGAQQPYMYDAERRDSRSPEKPFDPKAVTRASWEPESKKSKKKDGPLISFNRHPDAHEAPTGRTSKFRPMSGTIKWWIKFTRHVQLVLRLLEFIGGGGLLVLMILLTNVDPLTSWILRIAPGVVAISCVYAMWHLARPAHSRPPNSSAAYQLFAAFTDLAVLPLYAFGVISVMNHGAEWTTIMAASKELQDYLVESEHYLLLSAGGLHVISLCISIWLCLMFRRIANMPPDMNPLESHLTSRVKQHKRNKSSVATNYTAISEDSKRLSTPLENYRSSGDPYEDLSRPPSIPFMHTRSGSRDSFASSNRDSRSDLPNRQYQITPGNSPRNSATSLADLKQRMSTPQLAQRASYTEVPLHEAGVSTPSTPTTGVATVPAPSPHQPTNASPTRIAKFTESWYASESLINRTQERQRALNAAERKRQSQQRQSQYEALSHRYNFDDSDDDDDDGANYNLGRGNNRYDDIIRPDYSDFEDSDRDDDDNVQSSPINVTAQLHPNPLRLNPVPIPEPLCTPSSSSSSKEKISSGVVPRDSALSEVSPNSGCVTSGSHDIADEKPRTSASFWRRSIIVAGAGGRKDKDNNRGSRDLGAGATRQVRNSSIQPDADFYAKPYGELKPATPPIMVGAGAGSSDATTGGGGSARQVSGTDYGDLGGGAWRRRVSGKVAEEGLAGGENSGGQRYSRYSILNE